jgi:hypothetical protein
MNVFVLRVCWQQTNKERQTKNFGIVRCIQEKLYVPQSIFNYVEVVLLHVKAQVKRQLSDDFIYHQHNVKLRVYQKSLA